MEETAPPLSRVHELARLDYTALMGLYLGMLPAESGKAHDAVAGWDKDRIITAIRNMEDPR